MSCRWLLDGRRCSAAVAYLHLAVARGKVRVITGALATGLVIEDGRAAGVRYLKDGRAETARAGAEIRTRRRDLVI